MSAESVGGGGVIFRPKQSRFLTIPQAPIPYWLRDRFFELLSGPTLDDVADVCQGPSTADVSRFLRFTWEVVLNSWGLPTSRRRWVPLEKGGGYRKWFGYHFWAVDWENGAARVHAFPGSYLRNEASYFKAGWTYSHVARGSLGFRLLSGDVLFSDKSAGVIANSAKRIPGTVLNSRLSSFIARSLAQSLDIREGYVSRMPLPTCEQKASEDVEDVCIELKKVLTAAELTERTFKLPEKNGRSLAETGLNLRSRLEACSAVLHTLEGVSEGEAFAAYGLDHDDVDSVLTEMGTPAGWGRLLVDYEKIPPLPDGVKTDPDLLAPLKDYPRINRTLDELADLKRRLRALYEAGPGASPVTDEEAGACDSDDEESEEAAVSGACIPIPPETFLEELSQKLEIHPISVYWMLRELRERDGVVCLPELRRFVSDHFSVMILRVLGHRWPRQVEANEPVPDWAQASGIIPITEGAGAESLISRVRKRIAADFGAERVSAIEREFEEIMGVPLEVWLARDFFRNHISQFRKRPIAWQLQSTPETSSGAGNGRGKRTKRKPRADRAPIFSFLLYYHCLDDQLLGSIRTQYAHPMRLRMETELRELERIDAKARTADQEERRANLIVRIEELKDFEARLEGVEEAGFESEALSKIVGKEPLDKWTSRDGKKEHPCERDNFLAQEKRYDPDLNDGVRVNVAPLQKAGLLAADVLAAKDTEKAISDRAEWRADERRWCRAGKLPQPGWWR